MNTCANESCTTSILDSHKYCSKCHRAMKKARKNGRKKRAAGQQRKQAGSLFDMKYRTDKSGGLKTGMGLSYLKKLDRQRWEKKQMRIAQAIEAWGFAIMRMVYAEEAEKLRAAKKVA